MARPLRIEYPNALYHVTSRGNARKRIFKDDGDRALFFRVFAYVVSRCHWICHAYCLMDNHYHLLIETPEANLSRGMRQLNGMYTQAYNRGHGKVGHIFQGRFKAILLDKESYLLELCRYVVLNPVRAKLVERPEDWPWSSYRETAGMKKAPVFLETDWILGQFGNKRVQAEKQYRAFVHSGIGEESPWKSLRGQILLGTEDFIEKFKELLSKKKHLREVPRVQRHLDRPALTEILRDSEEKNRRQRNKRIHTAHIRHGYTLKEIADFLGVHYTTVSKAVRAHEEGY